MAHAPPHSPGSSVRRRWTGFSGLFFDEFAPDSAWIREAACVRLPPMPGVTQLRVRGEFRPHPDLRGIERGALALACRIEGGVARTVRPAGGTWETALELPAAAAKEGATLRLDLRGASATNALAWLGRITGLGALQRFRRQNRNRQIRVLRLETGEGETIYDFARRQAPFSIAFARRHLHLGLNIAGFLTADLGVGESARCMVRAADAAGLPVALVSLRLPCKNRLGDETYAGRLQPGNPHGVNVIHLDPPSARDLDHHHGKAFRAGKRNVGYWAWELPDFPDAWMDTFAYFDEIWCPSDFTRAAVAAKSPLPVLTMPHAIRFPRPAEGAAALRARFGLPEREFLFLFLYDLHSYTERKNPGAVIAAFRQSGLAGTGAGLVIKVQNAAGHDAELAALRASVADLPGVTLMTGTLGRADTYALEAACDCFVSLHRAEGFGLAVAECMYLGKPVIATDGSATAEYLTAANGCPVPAPLVTLAENHGPYMKGSAWSEPDPAQAARWMRELFRDRALAARLGAAARETIETRFAPEVIGERYRRRLEAIAWF